MAAPQRYRRRRPKPRQQQRQQPAADPFQHTTRDGSAYRDERFDEQRQRLERRLAWAFQRGDAAGVEHIERRLDALADEALTEIDPGRVPGPIERPHWWRPKA